MRVQTQTLNQAIYYADAGFTLTKLKGKIPVDENGNYATDWQYSDYQFSAAVKEDFKDWKGNFGIVLGKYDLVIDVDPRNFEEGDKPHVRLFQDAGIDIKQYAAIVKTGSGGLHIYLKTDGKTYIKEIQKKYKGLEFKSRGRQVVGATCIHPDTKQSYCLLGAMALDNIDLCPQVLLDIISSPEPEESGEDIEGNTDDLEVVVEQYTAILQNSEPAIEGQNGDHATYLIACRGRDLGLTSDKITELMTKYYNPRCLPPWSDRALKSKVRNVFRYASGAKGGALPEADFNKISSKKKPQHPLKKAWRKYKNDPTKLLKELTNVTNYFYDYDSELYDSLALLRTKFTL